MSAQPSLLELFEADQAAGVRYTENNSSISNRPRLNPFRKFFGPCARHCETPATVRLYFCHYCKEIGCWEWLKEHKD